MNRRDYKFFNLAKSVSECSDFRGVHIGAVLTYKNDILSVSSNSKKTCPLQKRYNRFRDFNNQDAIPKCHAEIGCLNKIPWYAYENDINFSKVKIYIWRSYSDGIKALSRPCPACMKALKDYGIRDIYYTTKDGYCSERIG